MSFSEPIHNPNLDVKSKGSTFKFQGRSDTFSNGVGTSAAGSEGIPLPKSGKKFPPVPQPRPGSQTFDNFEPYPGKGRRAPQLSKIIGESAESNGSPRPGLYFKKQGPSTNSLGNGTVSAANNANGRTQKIRRQNSMGNFGLQRMGSFSSDGIDEFEVRPTVVLDQDKIDAAKKRLLEAKLKKVNEETSTKKSWKQKFKWCGTTLVSLTIVLSSSSLLFVVPIIVDPILVGLDAQFSSKPVQCRTVSYENETGPLNCAMPSCREGCTADLYTCIFVSVVYTKETLSIADTHHNSSLEDLHFSLTPNSSLINGTLYINPSGCGYPPDVNCSIFEKTFREIGTVFPCYYSSVNSSIVVPFYSRHEEWINLSFALGIPLGLLFVASVSLFLLLRWDLNRVQDIAQDDITDEDLEAWRLSRSESQEILTVGNNKRNGKTSAKSKFNGHGPGGEHLAQESLSRSKRLDNSLALEQDPILKNNLLNGVAGISHAVVTEF